MTDSTEKNITSFDLLELLGLDLPLEEREQYYEEFLQLFLFNFILQTTLPSDETVQQQLQRELNLQKSPDEILATLQELHPDFMPRFIRFVESQKRLFIIKFLQGVIKNLERKKELAGNKTTVFDEKINRYQRALLAAQGEKWAEVKNILNPEKETRP
ncbi:hypothetical protein KJ707_03610 [Patescibacteria group bacterium]|nr:hypothetical protein [Patescibacteria group bacterium]MBU1967568.1 hypothetical protein [Patescibacteria group bacterium]MBU2543619.1 hypothetical protein [Patescibacteria group bacterium]